MTTLRTALVSTLLCIGVVGCSRPTGDQAKPLTEEQRTAKTRLEAQMKDAAQTAQTYHAMDNAALLTRLVEQGKAQAEPFNSPAYRELKTRTNVDSKALEALVSQHTDAGGLLPLLLLRRLDSKSYLALPAELRAKILTEALSRSKFFNVWGLPNFYMEDAARAMVESGRSAVPALRRLLSDTRPAPVFGSQESMMYKQYKYRVCDYALFFLQKLGGNPEQRLPISPAERDTLIKKEATAQ
jgi:hypothetical protein